MTVPAARACAEIIMATIAELVLVRMALHAGTREAHRVLFAIRCNIFHVTVADHPVPPVSEKIHVVFSHIFRGLHTLLLATRREFQFGCALCAPGEPTVPDWQGGESKKNYDNSCYQLFVIHNSPTGILFSNPYHRRDLIFICFP